MVSKSIKRTNQLPKDTKNSQKAPKKTMIKPPTKKRKNLTFRNDNKTTDKLIEFDMVKYLTYYYKTSNETYTTLFIEASNLK